MNRITQKLCAFFGGIYLALCVVLPLHIICNGLSWFNGIGFLSAILLPWLGMYLYSQYKLTKERI